jgi:protein gp37
VDQVPLESITDDGTPRWVIAGAESGAPDRVRPMDDDWVRAIRDRCLAAGIPFFFKQRAVRGRKQEHPLLDGMLHEAYPDDLR